MTQRAAALDDRLPRRAERRARSTARARTTRPAATACPTTPTASSTSSSIAGFWLRDDDGNADARVQHICWDGCMFPNAMMMQPQTWNDDPGDDDRRPRRARLGLSHGGCSCVEEERLNIGLVGYGFMGRTHSNAFLQAPRFFDLAYRPVLKAVCARNADRVKAFAENWGYESVETDWRKLVERKDIDVIDIASPNNTHAEIAIAAAKAGKMVLCEKPLGRTAAEAQGDGRRGRDGRRRRTWSGTTTAACRP